MKASIPHIVCVICLLVFIASLIIFCATNIINAYVFIALNFGSMIVFLYFLIDIILPDKPEDDEKKK